MNYSLGGDLFEFEDSEDPGEWVWCEADPDRAHLLLPFDDRYFSFTNCLAMFRQLFDGLTRDVTQVELKSAYRACHLCPATGSRGGYGVSARGLLQLKGQPEPEAPAPNELSEILGPQCDRIFGIAGELTMKVRSDETIEEIRTGLASVAEAVREFHVRLLQLEETGTSARRQEPESVRTGAKLCELEDGLRKLREQILAGGRRELDRTAAVGENPISEASLGFLIQDLAERQLRAQVAKEVMACLESEERAAARRGEVVGKGEPAEADVRLEATVAGLAKEIERLAQVVSKLQSRSPRDESGLIGRAPLSDVSKDRFRDWAEEYIKREQEITIRKSVRMLLEESEERLVEKATQSCTKLIDRALDERVECVRREMAQESPLSVEDASQSPSPCKEGAGMRVEAAGPQAEPRGWRLLQKAGRVRESVGGSVRPDLSGMDHPVVGDPAIASEEARGERAGGNWVARPGADVSAGTRGTISVRGRTEQLGESPTSGQTGEKEVADWRTDIWRWWTGAARTTNAKLPPADLFVPREYARRLFTFSEALRAEVESQGFGEAVDIEVLHCASSVGSKDLGLHKTELVEDGSVHCLSCGRRLADGQMSQLFLGLLEQPIEQVFLTLPPGIWDPSGLDPGQRALFRNLSTIGEDIVLVDVQPALVTVEPTSGEPRKVVIKNVLQRMSISSA